MVSGLIVEGKVDVRCTKEAAWDLFCRFGDVAALIPSVEGVEVDGDRVHARVATKLGALPVSSRVMLEVVERKPFACLKARGVSYLGETIEQQVRKGIEGVAADSTGQLSLHLDLRAGDEDGITCVIYTAEVEAKGRLKRIYQAILKTKVPGMMDEFAANIRGALEVEVVRAVAPIESEALAIEPPIVVEALTQAPIVRPSLWSRFVAWLRRLFSPREST